MNRIQALALRAASGTAALLLTLPSSAQIVRPGLWEHQFQMRSTSGQVEQQMAQAQAQMSRLPPEQRKMMEQMMAGMGMGLGGKPNAVRLCLTPEEAAKAEVPVTDGDCTNTVLERSAQRIRVRFVCKGQDAAKGEAQVDIESDKAYRTQADVRAKVDGRPEQMKLTGTSHWLDADCGTVKPMRRP